MPTADVVRHRWIAALIVSVLLVGCGATGNRSAAPDSAQASASPSPTGEAAPTPTVEPTVLWEPCEAPFECATVPVPLDRDVPDGETLDIALIRLPAPAAARRIGSLVVNPGGPGVSGLDFVRTAAVEVIPAEVRGRFDVVGFDPRGVGASRPVTCDGGSVDLLSHDLSPDDATEIAAVLDAAENFADSCGAASGDLLPHVGTREVARDLDAIRAAVGDPRLTYLGYSYGTRIGATYADLFPDNVRALVLDGAVDPSLDLASEVRVQTEVLETALGEFLAACADDLRCPLPPEDSTLQAFDTLMADLESTALRAPQLGSGHRLEPGQAAVGVVAMLRDRTTWPLLQIALAAASEGDGSYLAAPLGPATGQDGEELADGMAPLMAVNCLDVPAPSPEELTGLASELSSTAPRMGPVLLYLTAPCSFWPVAPVETPQGITAAGAPPIVVVGNRGDLVTPFAWSESLAGQLESGVLLTRDGDRHTAFGGENVCTDRAVIRYLVDLIPPDPTRTCG